VVAAALALAWPSWARVVVSTLGAMAVAAAGFVAVRHLAGAFQPPGPELEDRSAVAPSIMPDEVERLTTALDQSRGALPDIVAERLVRLTLRRLRDHHHVQPGSDAGWRHVESKVSPELYRLLVGDAAAVSRRDADRLIEEVAQL